MLYLILEINSPFYIVVLFYRSQCVLATNKLVVP